MSAVIRIALAALVFSAVSTAGDAGAVISNVDSADDICAPTADPCDLTDRAEIVAGSTLDFGTRHVRVTGGGQLDADVGSFTLRAGQLTITTSGQAIDLQGTIGSGESSGGVAVVQIFRSCSGNPSIRCLADSTCSALSVGACTVGSGDAVFDGKVFGSADSPGGLVVRTAGDLTVLDDMTINGNSFEADGGLVELTATGTVSVSARIEVNGGGDGGGGEVCLFAGDDVDMSGIISATGGNFDGGTIEFQAGNDILVSNDVLADAATGEGFGGSISMDAGRDLIVNGGSSANRLLLSTQGNQGICGGEAFGGDGGSQDYFAGRNMSFSEFVRMRADGAAPDGFGEVVSLDANGNILLEADIDSTARGAQGRGGELNVFAFGDVTTTSNSKVDLTGGDAGGGDVIMSPFGDVDLAGDIDLAATNGGVGGSLEVSIDRAFTLSGKIENDGAQLGTRIGKILIGACSVDIVSGGEIDNKSDGGENEFTVAEQMSVLSGGALKATSGGSSVIRYRDSGLPPVLAGNVNPAATTILTPTLSACPLCANGMVESGETCDDGNTVPGDGCNAFCVNEGCIAETPNYPSVPLCDDGDGCTVDTCNPSTSMCEYSTSCDDGFPCTIDSCSGTTCINTPVDSACDDGNACTDEVCTTASGCVFSPNSAPCDDGLFCNGADTCGGGTCSVHSGDPCAGMPECQDVCEESTQGCVAPFFSPCSDDGNECTDDVCNGTGQCTHLPRSGNCDDGVFCNGSDFCNGGACTLHTGNPCVGGPDCTDVCTEADNSCSAPAGTPCSDDGNVCTDDTCDAGGACLHTPNTAACDDGDFCTSADQCSGGACLAGDIVPVEASFGFTIKPGADDDRGVIKGSYGASVQPAFPSDTGVTFEIRDASGAAFFSGVIPAAAIVNAGDKNKTFKFKDNDGAVAGTGGITAVVFKRNEKKDRVRFRVRTLGAEYSDALAEPNVSMSVLFAEGAGSGDCVSARQVACKTSSSLKVRCK